MTRRHRCFTRGRRRPPTGVMTSSDGLERAAAGWRCKRHRRDGDHDMFSAGGTPAPLPPISRAHQYFVSALPLATSLIGGGIAFAITPASTSRPSITRPRFGSSVGDHDRAVIAWRPMVIDGAGVARHRPAYSVVLWPSGCSERREVVRSVGDHRAMCLQVLHGELNPEDAFAPARTTATQLRTRVNWIRSRKCIIVRSALMHAPMPPAQEREIPAQVRCYQRRSSRGRADHALRQDDRRCRCADRPQGCRSTRSARCPHPTFRSRCDRRRCRSSQGWRLRPDGCLHLSGRGDAFSGYGKPCVMLVRRDDRLPGADRMQKRLLARTSGTLLMVIAAHRRYRSSMVNSWVICAAELLAVHDFGGVDAFAFHVLFDWLDAME